MHVFWTALTGLAVLALPHPELSSALTLPSKASGQPRVLKTLGLLLTKVLAMFTEISSSSLHKTLWIDFKAHLDIWLEAFSNFDFCDKDSILPLPPSAPLWLLTGLIILLRGFHTLTFLSLFSLLSCVHLLLLLQLSPLCSSLVMELEHSNNRSGLRSLVDLGLMPGLFTSKLGSLGQIYLQLHASVSHLSKKDNNSAISRRSCEAYMRSHQYPVPMVG